MEFCVKYGRDQVSENIKAVKGVKQGCVLSPLLFNLFIDDVALMLEVEGIDAPTVGERSIPVLMYADDLCLFSTKIDGMQKGLDLLSTYCTTWGLTVNVSKTKAMTFKNGSVYSGRERWTYRGENLENVKNFVYLGMTLTMNGKWTRHIENATMRARCRTSEMLNNMSKLRNIPMRTLEQVYSSTVRATMLYGSELWGWERTGTLDKIQPMFLKKAMRLATGTSNCGILKEFGTFSDTIRGKIMAIKYWLDIINGNQDSLRAECYNEQKRQCVSGDWVIGVERGLKGIGMGWVWERSTRNNRNVWRTVKKRLIDIDRQYIEAECSQKISLTLQTELKLSWGREKYIDSLDGDDKSAIAWFHLGGWMAHNLTNEEGIKLCPLCDDHENWQHIIAFCRETEQLRLQMLPERFLRSDRGRVACWDLLGRIESESKTCKFLGTVRKLRYNKIVD